MKKRFQQIILVLIIVFGFIVRLYKINNPVADWHSWRQADTAAVTRNFSKFGFNLLYPRYDDLSNIASGMDNPKGYRFVEFPLYNAFCFILNKVFSQVGFSVEIWSRLVSIFSSLASTYLLFLICRQLLNKEIALLAAFFFSFLPFNIFYSRVILPEPLMVACSLAMTWFFLQWTSNATCYTLHATRYYFLALFFAALALLLKPFSAFLFTPLLYLVIKKRGFRSLFSPSVLLFFGLSIIPFILWRFWVARFPEGVPAWQWLLNGDGIRFKGAFFYWLFGERLAKLILGFWGLPLFLLGVMVKPKKEGFFFHWWAGAMLLYVSIVATGNVKHDYYQIITIPIICIFLAKGTYFLITKGKDIFSSVICYLLSVICILFMLAFSWHEVRTFYWINKPEIVEAGKIADQILPKNAKVIAPYGGDTAFLYQINRQGWPVGFSIEDKIKKGATHYVSVHPEDPETAELIKKYKLLRETDRLVIIDLRF